MFTQSKVLFPNVCLLVFPLLRTFSMRTTCSHFCAQIFEQENSQCFCWCCRRSKVVFFIGNSNSRKERTTAMITCKLFVLFDDNFSPFALAAFFSFSLLRVFCLPLSLTLVFFRFTFTSLISAYLFVMHIFLSSLLSLLFVYFVVCEHCLFIFSFFSLSLSNGNANTQGCAQ